MEQYILEDLEKIYEEQKKEREKNKDNNDTINELSARQQARDKLPVWYGSRDNYYHGLREVLNNAVDEISNNFDSGKITVFVEDDMQTISVTDTGRGIPIHKSTNGVPNYELLFERFFTSTNYNNADTGKISSGTNGVGTVVLNHTSSIFSVTTRLPEGAWNVTYTDGANECTGLTTLQADTVEGSYGTTVKFRLDPTMYTNSTYKMDEILNIVKHISATSNTIEFEVCERGEEEIIRHEFNYTSLKDYFEKETQMLTSKVLTGARTEREDEVEVQYGVRVKERNAIEAVIATSAEVVQETYLNYNWLKDNGTILEGIIQGIRSYMNAYAKENKLFPKSVKQFALSDIETSFSVMASIHGSNMEFANQTKFSTDKKLYRTIAMQKAKDMLEIHQVEDPESFNKMVKHLLLVQKNNESSRKATSKLKKQLSENVNTIDNRVEGLVDCVNHGKEAELFIVEGKSALGSIAMARDAKFQAVYPLRGKILNCRKSSLEDILSNDIIVDMIKAVGCGIEADSKKKLDLPPFDIEKLRYGKIVVACFTGDTTVMMADGTLKTFEELEAKYHNNTKDTFLVYSTDKHGDVVLGEARSPRITGTTDRLYEIILEDGQLFKCTPDHKWMTIDGKYVMAKDLVYGQELKSFGVQHRVDSIVEIVLEEEINVYCMTVEEHHNFLISTNNNSGVFVKNCDADADGEQIIVLVLTMFEALMPKLLENGYVFIVRTPLYEIHFKDDTVDYIFNEAEKEEKIKTIDSLNKAYKIARLKGLGEMDTEVMAETAMNVETRNLVSIGYNNLDDIEDKFETWMGKKVDKRKSIIETQLDKFVNGDI